MNKTYRTIGLMSGSSLDGLDVAYCRFECAKDRGVFSIKNWEVLAAETYPFSVVWKNRLRSLPRSTGFELMEADSAFGSYMGETVNRFLKENHIKKKEVDLVASHGHTVFHEPARKFTVQIGHGAALAVATGCPVITDFRSADIALGGQGAPLAPMADRMLFPEFDFCLNLGGIANITCNANGRFVAFDICGANQILDALAGQVGMPFDNGGQLARSGRVDPTLFAQQYSIGFFEKTYPKSLSNQWVQENQTDIFSKNQNSVADKLATAVELTARLVGDAIGMIAKREGFSKPTGRLMATGGGAHNDFLLERIRFYLSEKNIEVVVPHPNIIGFKEAILMGLLGVMRMENIPNCMASVTGASRDSVNGILAGSCP